MHSTPICMHSQRNYCSKGKWNNVWFCCEAVWFVFLNWEFSWIHANRFRFERLKAKDVNFEQRFNHLGNVGIRNGVTEFNWDGNLEDGSNEH